jgi:predicted P-loop ATPase
LSNDRDQLFAEARECYDAGEKWHPDAKFEQEFIFPEQDDRFEPDGWEPAVHEYIQGESKVYLGQIFEHALGIEVIGRDRGKQNRLTAILTRLGWRRLKKDGQGNRPWGPPNG